MYCSIAGAIEELRDTIDGDGTDVVVLKHDNLLRKAGDHHARVSPLCSRRAGKYGTNHSHGDDQPQNGAA